MTSFLWSPSHSQSDVHPKGCFVVQLSSGEGTWASPWPPLLDILLLALDSIPVTEMALWPLSSSLFVTRKVGSSEKQSLDLKIPYFNLIWKGCLFEKKLIEIGMALQYTVLYRTILKGRKKKVWIIYAETVSSPFILFPLPFFLLQSPLLISWWLNSWRMQKIHTAGPKKVVCIYGFWVLNCLHWCVGGRGRFCCLIKSKDSTGMGIENNKH